MTCESSVVHVQSLCHTVSISTTCTASCTVPCDLSFKRTTSESSLHKISLACRTWTHWTWAKTNWTMSRSARAPCLWVTLLCVHIIISHQPTQLSASALSVSTSQSNTHLQLQHSYKVAFCVFNDLWMHILQYDYIRVKLRDTCSCFKVHQHQQGAHNIMELAVTDLQYQSVRPALPAGNKCYNCSFWCFYLCFYFYFIYSLWMCLDFYFFFIFFTFYAYKM